MRDLPHRKEIRVAIHGDEFTLVGHKKELDWFRSKLNDRYTVNFFGGLAPGNEDAKIILILNRIAECKENALNYEAGQMQA